MNAFLAILLCARRTLTALIAGSRGVSLEGNVCVHATFQILTTTTRFCPVCHSCKRLKRRPSSSAISYIHYRWMSASIYCVCHGVPIEICMLCGF